MQVITETTTKAVNLWNNKYISPGPVASIGDVLQNVRLKQSAPELAMRWEFNDKQLQNRGNNVQDGLYESFSNDGLNAIAVIRDVYSDGYETKAVGDRMQNIVPSGLSMAPRILGRPQDSWKHQTAVLRRPPVMPLALPGGYPREGATRGPQLTHTLVQGGDYIDLQDPNIARMFNTGGLAPSGEYNVAPRFNPYPPGYPPGLRPQQNVPTTCPLPPSEADIKPEVKR